MASEISETLIAAYRATQYWVDEPPVRFCMKIGEHSEALAQLFAKSGLDCAAFISAYNPYSEKCAAQVNEDAHDELRRLLECKSVMMIEGAGRDPAGLWPAEKSLLAVGLSLERAKELGQRFGQNAVVWADGDAVPRLVLLR